jgi:endonuclease/exonuclease/phosphatase family metal-dependent hydrolase
VLVLPRCTAAAVILALAVPSGLLAQAVGDRVELKASHHLGVPLHAQAGGGLTFERVAGRTVATVVELQESGAWLRVQLEDARSGWISRRYVGRVLAAPEPPDVTEDERLVWLSPSGCEEIVRAGRRMPKSDASALRVGTWNIRWFPIGCTAQEDCPENATNVAWLACVIAWMDLDLLSLNEILDTAAGRTRLADLKNQLRARTGVRWASDLNRCGPAAAQHVGFLWKTSRVRLDRFADIPEMNGAFVPGMSPDACAENLRPGRYARVRSTAAGGVTLNAVSVHFDSGVANRDYQNRRTAVARIATLALRGRPIVELDRDILVLGDFNTMGRSEPSPVSGEQEIATLEAELAPAFRRIVPSLACSEYFQPDPTVERQRATLLDQIAVSSGMQEAATTSHITGYCAVRRCADATGAMPAAYQALSDHCPTVFEVTDRSLDPRAPDGVVP